MATIILLIRTSKKHFFTWQEHWASAGPPQAWLPGGAVLAMPLA